LEGAGILKNDERIEIPALYGTIVLDTKGGFGQVLAIAKKDYYDHRYSRSYTSQTRLGPIDRKAARVIAKHLLEWAAERKPSDRQVRYMMMMEDSD
jgi:hypothetical protein